MADLAFPNHAKSLTLSTGHTYAYVYISARRPDTPTILFLHGFPSSCYDWRHQISFFADKGYGVLAPDLLGYGGTSKPTSPDEYKAKKMTAEIAEILEHEKLESVHAVSHDIGSILLSRIANYIPKKLLSCSFLAVPYSKPGDHFDLDTVNKMTKDLLGKEKFGYLNFFIKDHAGEMLDNHSESFFTLFYPARPDLWDSHMGPTGAMEAWLHDDRKAPLAEYVSVDEKNIHQKILQGHHGPALNWYRPLVYNMNKQDELDAGLSVKIACPILVVLSAATAGQFSSNEGQSTAIADDLTVKGVSTNGHWLQLEARDEVNSILKDFFERNANEEHE